MSDDGLKSAALCEGCYGAGYVERGTDHVTCPDCNGTGKAS